MSVVGGEAGFSTRFASVEMTALGGGEASVLRGGLEVAEVSVGVGKRVSPLASLRSK
jgi:hypothetical protein